MILPSRWYRAELERRKARTSSGTVLAWCVTLATLATPPAHAQEVPVGTETVHPWSGELTVGANLAFGTTSWYFLTAGAEVLRADSMTEISVSGDFAYGEASDNQGVSFVNRRSWVAAAAVDLFPASKVSPFAFGSSESSLQAGIDRRWIAGAGAKLAFLRRGETRFDFSPALLYVRTRPRTTDSTETTLRASFRLRVRDLGSGRLKLSARVYFQPRVSDWGNYLFGFYSDLGVELTTRLSLQLSFVDRYDTESVGRGARSNNDGRLSLGLRTSF